MMTSSEQPSIVPPPPVVPAPDFDRVVIRPEDAGHYQWWYFDAISDDGRYGLVSIYFVGGVFSSHYADRWAAGDKASPFDHPMVNLALYDRQKKIAWVFSEYPREYLQIDDPALSIRIGRSSLVRRDGGYDLRILDDDFAKGKPVDARIRFEIESSPLSLPAAKLSRDGKHVWGSPAPHCRVSVDIPSHGLKWSGNGYHDMNRGEEPLHQGFKSWGWGRAQIGDETRLFYDAVERDGTRVRNVLTARAGVTTHEEIPAVPSPSTLTPWLLRVPQFEAGVSGGQAIRITREATWESSPFYLRFVGNFVSHNVSGRGVCEFVDLDRFADPLVRFMIRYRTYRRPSADGAPLPKHATWKEVQHHVHR